MKVLPSSCFGKLRFLLLLGLLLVVCARYRLDQVGAYYLSDKKAGDILFQPLPHGELADAIEGISQSPWSHCGILVRKDGKWMVAEAIGEVRFTPLHLWLTRGRQSRVEAWRLKNLHPGDEEKIMTGVQSLLGRPYDYHYAPGDSEIYCSELVYKVAERQLGVKIGNWDKLGDLNWKPWEKFIREIEDGQLPLDRPMITPVGLTRSPEVVRVYPPAE